jgi:hypothetical protein
MLDQKTAETAAPPLPPKKTPEQELKELREFYAIIAPQIDQIQRLVQAGWVQMQPGEQLIQGLLKEITLLRAERIPPPMDHSMVDTCQAAFAQMSAQVREGLHRTEKSVQQTRFEAFQAATLAMIPTIMSKGRLEAYYTMELIANGDLFQANRVLEILSRPDAAKTEASEKNKIRLTAQKETLARILTFISGLKTGGMTPEQAIKSVAADQQKEVSPPPGVTVN